MHASGAIQVLLDLLFTLETTFFVQSMKFGLYVTLNNALEEYKIWVTWCQKWGHGIKP